jgi:hypothetical protein
MAPSNFPYTFSTIPDTLKSSFKEPFPAYTEGLVQSNPGNFVYHSLHGAKAKKFYDFPIRKDDVWIRTFPRSGNQFNF